MASGGGLTDLILRCLVFGAVPFWKVSPWLLMAQRIYKKVCWARRSLTAFNGRTWEDRDTRELQDIGSSHRLSHRKRERDRLASGVAHARSVPRCVQGSSLYFTQIGDEGDDPHWIPALAAGQGIDFVDFPNPFRPAWRLLSTWSHRYNLHHDLLERKIFDQSPSSGWRSVYPAFPVLNHRNQRTGKM